MRIFLITTLLLISTNLGIAQEASQEAQEAYRKIDDTKVEVTKTVVSEVTIRELLDQKLNLERRIEEIKENIAPLQDELDLVNFKISEFRRLGVQ